MRAIDVLRKINRYVIPWVYATVGVAIIYLLINVFMQE